MIRFRLQPNQLLGSVCAMVLALPWTATGAEPGTAPPAVAAKPAPEGRVSDTPAPGNAPVFQLPKFPGLEINLKERCVDVECTICLDEGMLELIACTKDSKEHESIVAIEALPKHVHTALLLLGAKPGNPAMRKPIGEEGLRWIDLPPQGDPVGVFLVFEDDAGKQVERPIRDFLAPSEEAEIVPEEARFPTNTFVFAGSIIHGEGPGPRKYLSDLSGNVISITTFGDELLCLAGIHSHANGMLAWQVDSTHLPAVGSKITLRLRPHTDAEPGKGFPK